MPEQLSALGAPDAAPPAYPHWAAVHPWLAKVEDALAGATAEARGKIAALRAS